MKKLIPIAIACLFAVSIQAQNTPASTPSQSTPAQAAPAPTPIKQATQTEPASATHDGVMMKDGKMWVTKGGKTMLMTADMTMKDGTKVMTDGTYMTKDGKKMTLKNGEAMGMDGKVMKADMPKKAPEPKAAPSK